jgi:hypothetical protein
MKKPPLSASIVPETFRATLLDFTLGGKSKPEGLAECCMLLELFKTCLLGACKLCIVFFGLPP